MPNLNNVRDLPTSWLKEKIFLCYLYLLVVVGESILMLLDLGILKRYTAKRRPIEIKLPYRSLKLLIGGN